MPPAKYRTTRARLCPTVTGEPIGARIAFEVIARMWRKRAFMAIVVEGRGIPHGDDVVGVITKEHVADSVASSMKIYPN